MPLAVAVNEAIGSISQPISIAVMGCEVNGPGEAKSADYGVAGGNGVSLIFKKGQVVARASTENQLTALMDVINEDLASAGKEPVLAEAE